MSTVIDGKALAARMRAEIKERVAAFKAERGREIGLAVVLVGEDSASQVYVRNKIKACEEVGDPILFVSFARRRHAESGL